MAKLEEAMAYLCARYPYKSELSKARLTKMIYLADWRLALTSGRQVTNLTWIFNHYGPYLDDVKNEAQTNPRFELRRDRNMFGNAKEIVALRHTPHHFDLSEKEMAALEHVIDSTKDLTWGPFISLVYSTYPIATQPRYQRLDLPSLATVYKQQNGTL
jgi:hypothetical protein